MSSVWGHSSQGWCGCTTSASGGSYQSPCVIGNVSFSQPVSQSMAVAIEEPERCDICNGIASTSHIVRFRERFFGSWTRSGCAHQFCKSCLSLELSLAVQARSETRLKCPGAGCDTDILGDEAESILPRELYTQYYSATPNSQPKCVTSHCQPVENEHSPSLRSIGGVTPAEAFHNWYGRKQSSHKTTARLHPLNASRLKPARELCRVHRYDQCIAPPKLLLTDFMVADDERATRKQKKNMANKPEARKGKENKRIQHLIAYLPQPN